jgi:hypothetical protein
MPSPTNRNILAEREIDHLTDVLKSGLELEQAQQLREAIRRRAGEEFDAFRDEVLESARLKRQSLAVTAIKPAPVLHKRSTTRRKKNQPLITSGRVKTRPATGKRPRKGV